MPGLYCREKSEIVMVSQPRGMDWERYQPVRCLILAVKRMGNHFKYDGLTYCLKQNIAWELSED